MSVENFFLYLNLNLFSEKNIILTYSVPEFGSALVTNSTVYLMVLAFPSFGLQNPQFIPPFAGLKTYDGSFAIDFVQHQSLADTV